MSESPELPAGAQEHILQTDDGWTNLLVRYPGKGPPVLFVHGMGANRYNFDLNPRQSLARTAAAAGWDCWVVELRGRGRSQAPEGKADWNFEDFLHRDLTSAVRRVQEITGKPVHWVGHSMGGMLGVAFVECYGDAAVRSLTLFGTPLAFERDQWMLRLWGTLAQVHRVVPTMDQEKWGRRMLPLMKGRPEAMKFFLRYLANPDNVETDTSRDIFERLVTNESPGITLQFSDWVRSGEVRSSDHSFSYTQALARVRLPALFISGVEDMMAPAENTARHMTRLSSRLLRQVVLSKDNGFSADYGHGDLLVGRRSAEEVFPVVLHWLREVEEA
jgi:pimeloyl-ACP methyl ester carboxylesterase